MSLKDILNQHITAKPSPDKLRLVKVEKITSGEVSVAGQKANEIEDWLDKGGHNESSILQKPKG